MSYFNRKPVPPSIQSEITRRAEDVLWVSTRGAPYIQLTSMCSECNPAYQLSQLATWDVSTPTPAQNNSTKPISGTLNTIKVSLPNQNNSTKPISGTLNTIKTSSPSQNNGNKKVPVIGKTNTPINAIKTNAIGNKAFITNINVKKQGELGTSRKATIQLHCSTTDELMELQKCYFIPGMSVRLQWGWSSLASPAIEQLTTKPTDRLLDSDALKKMITSTEANANHEGMQGPVTNFAYIWNQRDHRWECSVDIVSGTAGTVIESDCKKDPTYGKSEEKEIILDRMETLIQLEAKKGVNLGTGGLIATGLVAAAATVGVVALTVATAGIGTVILAAAVTAAGTAAAVGAVASGLVSNDTDRKEEERWTSVFQYEGDTRDPLHFGKADGGFYSDTMGTGTNEAYISLGKLTDIINTVSYGNLITGFTIANTPKACNFDGQTLVTPEHLGCSDARICFIPGTQYLEHLLDDYEASQVPSAFKVIPGNKGEVIINLIAVNAIHALQAYHELLEAAKADPNVNKGKVVTKDFLDKILNDINVSCGNPWKDLRVELNPQTNVLMVVERQTTGGGVDVKPFNLPVGSDIEVLDDLRLELKMTGAMKTQAVYGSNTSVGNGDLCTKPTFQAFGLSSGLFKNMGRPEIKPKEECKLTPEEIKAAAEDPVVPKTTEELFEKAGNGHVDGNCTNLAERLSAIYEHLVDPTNGKVIIPTPEQEKAACKNIPLPFEMSFVMDGIGGFGFGQVVTSTFIPPKVTTEFEFQILDVSHVCSAENWKIEVTTVARTASKTTT